MKKLTLSVLALLAGTSFIFAGPQGERAPAVPATAVPAATGTVRWAYWGGENRVRISQAAIDLFHAANPGIRVNPEPSGGTGDHFIKVDTQLAGGSGPDIIQMGGNIHDYVRRGVLLPLNAYAGRLLNTSVIDPGAIESGTIDGQLFGVSTGVTMPALAFNKSMIERAGVPLPQSAMTYREFRAYLMTLRDRLPRGVFPMQDIGALPTNSTPFGYWARFNGTPLFNSTNRTTGVTPAVAQKYLELFKDYRDNGLVPPPEVASGFAEQNADTSALVAGRVAIGFIWTNQLVGFQGAMQDEIGLIQFPGSAATKALWQAPSQFYTVNKDSKNIEAAVTFINFLVNSPDAARVLGNDRGASASSTARAAALANPADQRVLEYLRVAGPNSSRQTPHLPHDTEFNSTLYLHYMKVAFGQITPAEGGRQISEMIVRLINK